MRVRACANKRPSGVKIAHFGRHAHYETPESKVRYFELLYALQIMYPLAITSIKFSIILFYRRIFHVPSTVKPLLAIGGIVAAWCIAMVRVSNDLEDLKLTFKSVGTSSNIQLSSRSHILDL